MSKITLKEAIERTGKSESTISRDMRSGKVSYRKRENGRVAFDTAELKRVYGDLKPVDTATNTANAPSMTAHETPVATSKVIALLENHVAELQTQLTASTEREKTLFALTDRRQKHNERLMLPPPETKRHWWQRLVGAR